MTKKWSLNSATIREFSRLFEKIRPGREGKGKGREKEKEKEKEEKEVARRDEKKSAIPKKTTPLPPPENYFCEIPLVGKGEKLFYVTMPMIDEWQQSYPGVDVKQAIREIRAWNVANPTRRKTSSGIARHIVTWLQHEQNRGGTVNRVPTGQSKTYEHNVVAISQGMRELIEEGAR